MVIKPYEASSSALDAMQSTDHVWVSNEAYISFIPKEASNVGVIFYQGAKVDAEAYAPIMHALADQNINSFIAEMPFNYAFLSPNRADAIIKDHDNIKTWYIAGHSLGGVMASAYAYENNLEGLILLASYPQDKHDFSEKNISVLSIIGSKDGLIELEKIESKKELLPESTEYIVIEGGNHAQMGSYGIQKKDQKASVDSLTQQKIVIEAILKMIKSSTAL